MGKGESRKMTKLQTGSIPTPFQIEGYRALEADPQHRDRTVWLHSHLYEMSLARAERDMQIFMDWVRDYLSSDKAE
jgi:hypothetical protein